MKIYFILTAILYLIMMLSAVIPLTVTKSYPNEQTVQVAATVKQTDIKTDPEESDPQIINVFRNSDKSVDNVELRDYVYGSVAAEIPVDFHDEAIKAQAVACYSFALWIKNNSDNPTGEISDVSDDPNTHQGYLDKQQMEDLWGDNFEENYNRIKTITDSVYGEYLSYNNEPIMAVYHSLSPGHTADASEIWANDLPYLKSTTAPGDTLSPDYISTESFSRKELKEKFKKSRDINFDFESKPLGKTEKTQTGYIKTATFYSVKLESSQIRSILNLKSPFFTIEEKDGTVTFTVYGHGHGVGMSQNSADYMARQGSNYKEILQHFYKNTILTQK